MKRTNLATLGIILGLTSSAFAQQRLTQEQLLDITAAIASEQLAIQEQQLDELRAIRRLQQQAQEAQQCQPYDSGLPWVKPGYIPLR